MNQPDNMDCLGIEISGHRQIAPEKMAVFLRMLRRFLPFSCPTNTEQSALSRISIVPDAELERAVNDIAMLAGKPGTYRVGTTLPPAVTVPIEDEAGVTCIVVVAVSLLATINSEEFSADVISTVLEELLHIRLYSAAWQRRRWIEQPPGVYGCKLDLVRLCSGFHDEYVCF